MADLISAARLLTMGARVAWRRGRRGPQRPGWSFVAELSSMFMKEEFHRTRRQDLATLRAHVDRMALPLLPPHRVVPARTRLGAMPAWELTPPEAHPDQLMLYLHGGGYVFGSIRDHGAFVSRLASMTRLRTLFPEYRLAPEHPYPAALDDAEIAYRALLDDGVDPQGLVLAGESAGGGLSVALLLRLRELQLPMPRVAVLVSPWVDHTFENPSIDDNAPDDFADRGLAERWSAAYLQGADPRDPFVSPVFADLRGLPPLLVQCGGAEMLRDEVRTFARRAREAGVDVTFDEWDDMFHVWQFAAPLLPEANRAMVRLARWIDDHRP